MLHDARCYGCAVLGEEALPVWVHGCLCVSRCVDGVRHSVVQRLVSVNNLIFFQLFSQERLDKLLIRRSLRPQYTQQFLQCCLSLIDLVTAIFDQFRSAHLLRKIGDIHDSGIAGDEMAHLVIESQHFI